MHPKYRKHLKEGAQNSLKNGLVSGKKACTSSKTWNQKQYNNTDFTPEFSIQFRMFFRPLILTSERNNLWF